jgi:hypothetical protein
MLASSKPSVAGIAHHAAESFGQQLRVPVGGEIEQDAAAGRRQRHHGQRTRDLRARQPHLGAALAPGRRFGFRRNDAHEDDPERQAGQAGDRERRPPTEPVHQQARQRGGHRDAEVARQAVDADRCARPSRALQQHRDADRVIDRRERADERERRGELPGPLRHRREQRGRSDPEEEDDHHRAAAPEVTEPAGGQRSEAEHHERADAERHQVFPAREAELGGDAGHRRGEDQQEHVVHRVGHVQKKDHAALVHGAVAQG